MKNFAFSLSCFCKKVLQTKEINYINITVNKRFNTLCIGQNIIIITCKNMQIQY